MEEERNYEEEARQQGWRPKEEWNGPDDQWKPAEQFVKDGEKITGILKSKVDRLEERVQEVLETNRQFAEMTKRQREKDQQEKDRLLKELKQARAKAVAEGDGEAFTRLEDEIESVQRVPEQQEIPVAAQQFLKDNPWYEQDNDLGAYADGISDRLRAQGFNDQSPAFFKEIEKRVKDAFPQKFENKNRTKPNGVESGGEVEEPSGKKTFADLPKEAKDAFARFKRDIPGFTKEQFLADYDWE